MTDKNDTDTSSLSSPTGGQGAYWRRWYLLVFLFLIAQIIFFLYLTRHFA